MTGVSKSKDEGKVPGSGLHKVPSLLTRLCFKQMITFHEP